MKITTQKQLIRLILIAIMFVFMFSLSSCKDNEARKGNELPYGYYYHSGDTGTTDYTIELSNKDIEQWDFMDSTLIILYIHDITIGEGWTGRYTITGQEGIAYEIDGSAIFMGAEWIEITNGYIEIKSKKGNYFELEYDLDGYKGEYNGQLEEI